MKQPDPLLDGQLATFAPSGAIAGVIARTDGTRGVWKAPAGTEATLSGVADLEVPRTYSEFLTVCETLQDAEVPPLYSTFLEPWSIAQGLVDYSVGGMIDVADFFTHLRDLGPDAGPDAEVSFIVEILCSTSTMLIDSQLVTSPPP